MWGRNCQKMLQMTAATTCLILDAQKIPAALATAKTVAEEGGQGEVMHFTDMFVTAMFLNS